MKRCCSCKARLLPEAFNKNRSCKDGLQELCRACQRSANQRYKDANREKVRAAGRAYALEARARNPAAAKRASAAWRARNLEKVKARDAANREKNKEKRAATYRAWYARNREVILAKSSAIQRGLTQEQRDAHNAKVRERYAADPVPFKLANDRRRARLANVLSTLTEEQWLAILELTGHACAYCGRADAKLEMDHVLPLSRGGGTTAENVVPACRSCNSSKRARTPEEWKRLH